MRVFAISDLHLCSTTNKPMDIFGGEWENYWEKIKDNWKSLVTEDDVVLIAGDISWAMKLNEAIPDLREISKLPGKKILIKGNHDYWWQSLSNIRKCLPENIFVIQNDAIKIGKFIFCGSRGWIVAEDDELSVDDEKIFKRELIRMELSLHMAINLQSNDEKIIAMIHYPPFNSKFQNGFMELFERFKVKSVVYGHLHGKSCRTEKLIEKNGVKYYLTSCDQINNKLVEIEV